MKLRVSSAYYFIVLIISVVLVQVMLACAKYNLVYEFFNKVKRSYIPSALNYKGMLLVYIRIITFQRSIA
jgi:hypothetical protein